MAQLAHSEYMLFNSLPMSYQVRNSYMQKIPPEQSNVQDMSEISFLIKDTNNSWIDLNSIYMEVVCEFKKDAATKFGDTKTEGAYLENNLFHSLWESIDLELNDQPLRGSESDYAYRSYMETIMKCTKDDLDYLEPLEQFYAHDADEDLNQVPHSTTTDKPVLEANNSITRRQGYQTQLSKPFHMVGKLNVDLLKQGKSLPPMNRLKIILTKKKPEFYIRSIDKAKHHFVFRSVNLYVTKTTLQDDAQVKQDERLHKAGVGLFPILRTSTYSMTIPPGVDVTIPRFITGPIPRRVVIGFVDNEAKGGSFDKNPFKFESMFTKELWLSYDGKDYPTRHYETDFGVDKERKNHRAYRQYRQAVYPFDTEPGQVYLSYSRWLNGHTLFAFDLTPDESGATGEYYRTPPRSGDISLELKRSNNPEGTWNAIVYCEYHNEIGVRFVDGKPITDY